MFNDPALEKELVEKGIRRSIASGTELMRSGYVVSHVPILLSGTIRVLMQSEKGAERYLYHIFPGETCAMAIHCCQNRSSSSIRAVIEDDADLVMVPSAYLQDWLKYPEWRNFLDATQARRFNELMTTLEQVAFNDLEAQLWRYLSQRCRAQGTHELRLTQQAIADELATSREAITRRLLSMQDRGLLELGHRVVRLKRVELGARPN